MYSSKMRARVWHPVFLKHLARTGNVTKSAKLTGVAPMTVRRHREKLPRFETKCREAIQTAVELEEEEARTRAVEGSTKIKTRTTYHADGSITKEVTEEVTKSDVLLMFHLKSLAPHKFRDNYDLAKVVAAIAHTTGSADRGSERSDQGSAEQEPDPGE